MKIGDLVRYCTAHATIGREAEYVLGIIVDSGPTYTSGTIWRVFWSFPDGAKAYGVHDHDIEVINESR
jgi:hypothetical protein